MSDQTSNATIPTERRGLRRFTFVPFWRLTNCGWLPEYLGRIQHWGDETHRCRVALVPFVGEFIWWDRYPCDDPDCDACRDGRDEAQS